MRTMPPRKKATTGKPAKAAGGRARKAESVEGRRARATKLVKELHRVYPDATCALHHRSALELVVSTILSAQCTDERVNMVTPVLFKRYRTVADLAGAEQEEVEGIIRSTGFFRNKAKSIIGLGRELVERFKGEVPSTMEELLELPGVARKTANVVLGTWFDKNVGVVVDTHIGRLSHRLGLTWRSKDDKDAVRIEQDLMEVLPQAEWTFVGHALIWHGRRVCAARKPDCEHCSLAELCPSAFAFDAEAKKAAGKNRS